MHFIVICLRLHAVACSTHAHTRVMCAQNTLQCLYVSFNCHMYRLFKLVYYWYQGYTLAGIYIEREYQSSQIKVFHKSHMCRQSLYSYS